MRGRFRTVQLAVAGVVMAVALCAAPRSHAAMVSAEESGAISLFQASAVVGGQQTTRAAFTIPTAGKIIITLRDLVWPAALESLTFCLTDAPETKVFTSLTGPGEYTFDIGSSGQFFGWITTVAQGSADLGRYSVDISLVPVPLPAALGLLLSGLAGLALLRRRRSQV